jgi:hypothetical protein
MQCLNAAGVSPSKQQITACYDSIYGNCTEDEETDDENNGDTKGSEDLHEELS